MPGWLGVDLSLVVTLYGVFGFVFVFRVLFFYVFFTKEADEKRELCGDTLVVLMCLKGEYLGAWIV